ncbi:MAG: alpha/beta fold hydrolase [Chloroflexota bacterium]
MSVDLLLRRLRRLGGPIAATVCAVAWGALLTRLQLRALHLLQLEGYQTLRYLRWSVRHGGHWSSRRGLTTASVVGGLAALDALTGARPVSRDLMLAAVAGLGAWRWWEERPRAATKPLVLTSRAKRLLAGQSVLSLAMILGPAALCAIRGRDRGRAAAALVAGAAAASLVSPPVAAAANLLLWPVEEAFRRYYLRDARRLLQEIGPVVVGVAGSYGKTSTKEITATILAARFSVLRPPGSFNTPMGISRIVRERLEPTHQIFVAELGDYVPGDIRFLCNLVHPKIGILTTIGPEHLERFKTMDRIVQTKQELIDALPEGGIAIVNQDDPLVRAIGDRAEQRGLTAIRYGQTEPGAQVRARDVQTTRDGLTFMVEVDGIGEAQFQIGLLGRHNVMNVLAGTAAGLALGMTLPEIALAARRIEPVEHRLQPIQGAGGVLVIDDTYNSNPRGAAEALMVLGELPGNQKVLVTPGMIELAERETEEHRLLGQRAAEVCDHVILVGPERTRPIAEGLLAGGFAPDRIHVVASRDAATAELQTLLQAGDVLLWENDLPDTYAEETGDRRQESGVRSQESGGAEPVSQVVRVGAMKRAPTGDSDAVRARFIAPPDSSAPSVSEHANGTSDSATILAEPEQRANRVKSTVVDGLRVVYREDGPPDGPPVIVLHGWGASKEAVASIQACLRMTHRTIALDLPGFGESDPPPVAWGSEEYAELVRGFMQALGIERASVVGHSHGGRVSIVLAATYPELVDRLVLVNSAGLRPKRGPKYYARVYGFKAGRTVLASPALSGAAGAPLRRALEARFGSTDYRQAGPMRGTLVRVVNEDWRHLLPRIAASTLLIWGDQDRETPLADGQLMEQLIPDAGLVVFSGAGHFSYADDLDRFGRVVRHFLA